MSTISDTDDNSNRSYLKLLSSCPELADQSDILKVGLIAYLPISDQSTDEVRRSIMASDWPTASRFAKGDFSLDLVQWLVIIRNIQPSAIVEVVFWSELLIDDEVTFVRSLSQYEVDRVALVVRHWAFLKTSSGDDNRASS